MAMNGTGHAQLARPGQAIARQGQRKRAGRVMRPGHPRRQAVLLPGHGAAGHDHRDSDPGRPGTAPGSLGDTGSVMPALTRAGRLNRTALRHLGPGSAWLPAEAGKRPTAARDAADHAWLTSRRSGVSCCGVQHGESGTGQPLDEGSRPGKGPATSRQRRTALVADGTDSGPKGRPGPVPPGCLLHGYARGKGFYLRACHQPPSGGRTRQAGYPAMTFMGKCRAPHSACAKGGNK
jgi:hypothetical protein